MKAVVVEIRDRYAVALNKKGEFVKIKNSGRLVVGHEVDAIPVGGFELNSFAKIASIAAVFLFSITLGFGSYAYTKPYSYVDVDINPSVELVANRFDRIIEARALNADGEKLLVLVQYKNRNIQAGVDSILKSALDEGYFKTNLENTVLFTVSGNNPDKVGKMEEAIKANASVELKTIHLEAQVLTEKVSLERRDEAIRQGVSPGRLLLAEKVLQVQPEAKMEDLIKTPVRELVKSIKGNRKDQKADLEDSKKKELEDQNREENNKGENNDDKKSAEKDGKGITKGKESKEPGKPAAAISKLKEETVDKRDNSPQTRENIKKNDSKDNNDEKDRRKDTEKEKERDNENDKKNKRE